MKERQLTEQSVDWTACDRLRGELHGAHLAVGSYLQRTSNLEEDDWDEHGVYPNEAEILARVIGEIKGEIVELGTPPACVECTGDGEVYCFTEGLDGTRSYDKHPRRCPRCRGDGEYRGEEGLGSQPGTV